MLRRPESLRERTLLRLIERQAQTISDLNDRLMHMADRTWALPQQTSEPLEEPEDEFVLSALDSFPEA